MKRLIAIITAIVLVLSLSSCGKKNEESKNNSSEKSSSVSADNGTASSDGNADTVATEAPIADIEEFDTSDPSLWTTEQIVGFYRSSASLTHPDVKSQHKIEIKDISVNNGQFESFFDFISSIMSKLLDNNSEDKDGITGGYQNLTASDVASAKAYKSGNNIVIEMTMKDQVSDGNEDANSGTVGHAITTVGDIGDVITQMEDLGLPLEISEQNTEIVYTNATVKVVINENGKIINGTWKYTVSINLSDYKAFGKNVETTNVVMDNKLTVNGGFNK